MAVLAVLGPEESAQLQRPGLLLGREEFAFLCVEPGPALGSHLSSGTPRALILDADIPEVSAFHLVPALRRTPGWEKLPIVLISEKDCTEEARHAGASLFFRKPVDVAKFSEALGGLLESKARRYRRRPLSGPCLVIAAGRQIEAKLLDVSVSGLRAKLDAPLTPGGLVQLRFGIPMASRVHVVRCNAKVARRIPEGFGFAFSTMATDDRSILNAFTQKD